MRLLKPSVCMLLLLLLAYPLPIFALPADPNNAALLYYQAIISLPSNYGEMPLPLEPSPSGIIEPNEAIRDYLKTCDRVFDLTNAAAKLKACDWGIRHTRGDKMDPLHDPYWSPHLPLVRQLCLHIMTQAQVYAADKEYQKALENCLVIRKISQHIGDDNMLYLGLNVGCHGLANRAIRQVLSMMPPNLTMLAWLEKELAQVSQRPDIGHALATEEQSALRLMNKGNHHLMQMAETCRDGFSETDAALREKSEDELLFQQAINEYNFVSISAFIEGSRAHYKQTMVAMRAIMDEPITFMERRHKLQNLDERIQADGVRNPHAFYTSVFITQSTGMHAILTQIQSDDDLLKVAIHLYRIQAQTGEIPDVLPEWLPKNSFDGKAFDYEKTDDGFILRMEVIGRHMDEIECVFRVK